MPPLWLKICGQIGPTGTYNRKSLASWFADLLLRVKQLRGWVGEGGGLERPPSVWISGLFNPMDYVNACLQVTARAKGLALDSMAIHTEVTSKQPAGVQSQPAEGTYVHGLFMEGARWDVALGAIAESRPKEFHPPMPVLHITARAADAEDPAVAAKQYECPVYASALRGDPRPGRSTFSFSLPLRTREARRHASPAQTPSFCGASYTGPSHRRRPSGCSRRWRC